MGSSALANIQNVVVLMFENRSFDHMFGGLVNPDGTPMVNGVLGPNGQVDQNWQTTNLYNTDSPTQVPTDPSNTAFYPTGIDLSGQPPDFTGNHDFHDGMMPDLFGPYVTGYVGGQVLNPPGQTWPSTNCGFVNVNGANIMNYFVDSSLQVLHPLAKNFVICQNWHCDMPGHTMPNRDFMHCATTSNLGIDDPDVGVDYAPTIFELIQKYVPDNKQSWKIYVPPGAQSDGRFLNKHISRNLNAYVDIAQFAQDVSNDSLPFYSFLMCWSASSEPDTSMHPSALVQPGENLLAAVYNTLISNPAVWSKTLLIVNFDENGGIYDHVVPPQTVKPSPNALPASEVYNGITYMFDFGLLGPRIPVVLISPWLNAGVDSTLYQNTSILRFIEDKLVPLPASFISLTNRDAQATSIVSAFQQFGSAAMRTNCPQAIAGYTDAEYVPPWITFKPGTSYPYLAPDDSERAARAAKVAAEKAALPPKPYQVEVAREYAARQRGHADFGKPIKREFPTNADLSRYVQQRMQAADWYDEGEHLKASIQIVETAPGQWIWELKDAAGAVLAAPRNHYKTRELALKELDRVRFLFHELCCKP